MLQPLDTPKGCFVVSGRTRLDDVRFIPKSELAANALRQREPLGGRIDRIVVVRGKEPSVRRPAGNSRKLNFAARRQRRAEG